MFKTLSAQVNYDEYPVYGGTDLGLVYTPQESVFRIWAPTASKAELLLYNEGLGGEMFGNISMQQAESGTWIARVPGDLNGKFYAFRVWNNQKWSDEVPDPYAKAVGVNGKRAMVIDLQETNPPGWEKDISPSFGQIIPGTRKGGNPVDAIIYELHVRDASIDPQSGISNKGIFLGLTETGTVNSSRLKTGLDHLKELGVTHIHLLPSYDYSSVDETHPEKAQYNWGYDPLNYNVPEGSYSTNPYDGVTRIREFKKLIQTFHGQGLRVIMDVVYNHTMFTEHSWFNQLVPGYYYRHLPDGHFSNATACGNETASERPMMRKFMLESVKYWVEEYHVDGFRFDLMGVHDIETMNLISGELHRLKPDILLYGEGWTAGESPIPDSLRALKKNAHLLNGIAVFSDDIRDGIKGSVFEIKDRGFASGKPGLENSIKFGVVAACRHPQIIYEKVNYSKAPYADNPSQVVSYCECHDNNVLWDKLALSAPDVSERQRKEMHKLALSIVLTAQGISFLHAGTEFLRSKYGNENSFQSGDSVNAIRWYLKTLNKDVFEYVQFLIQIRKDHPAFRLLTAEQVQQLIRFQENLPDGLVAFELEGSKAGDTWKKIFVSYNGSQKIQNLNLPPGRWKSAILNNSIATGSLKRQGKIKINASACTILYQN